MLQTLTPVLTITAPEILEDSFHVLLKSSLIWSKYLMSFSHSSWQSFQTDSS